MVIIINCVPPSHPSYRKFFCGIFVEQIIFLTKKIGTFVVLFKNTKTCFLVNETRTRENLEASIEKFFTFFTHLQSPYPFEVTTL